MSVTDKYSCYNLGGEWMNQDSNFDNVGSSMMTLFIMSTTEGWIPIMWNGVDSTAVDQQPVQKNTIWWVFFFIAFIVVGSLFILNLFVGVVINMFSSEKDKLSKNHLLTRQQQEWV